MSQIPNRSTVKTPDGRRGEVIGTDERINECLVEFEVTRSRRGSTVEFDYFPPDQLTVIDLPISVRQVDQRIEELSLRNGGESICVCPPCTLDGHRDVVAQGDGAYRIEASGTVRETEPYGVWIRGRDWDPEEARG